MINYERYCQIKACRDSHRLGVYQIARKLRMDPRTVAKWLAAGKYQPRREPAPRPSKLDPFKQQITHWLANHPYSAAQILLRLRDQCGYRGGISIVKDYVRQVRPPRTQAYLTLHFAPGEAAQVDWGEFGTINVGNTRRRLSFFAMVLCYSRMLYVQFTLSQTMEHFLACHANAFAFFGGVPSRCIVDNLKSAILQHAIGETPLLNPRYKDFADHYGFVIDPCNVRQPQEKGRVENAVGYIKKNFLAGLQVSDFALINPAARLWMQSVANVRIHGSTRRQPAELFKLEKLKPLPLQPYDLGVIRPVRANRQFRVVVDTNAYSVPAQYAGAALTLKLYPDLLCLYHQDQLIARHLRRYDRQQDIEDPDHPKLLLQQRRKAQDQKLLIRLLNLTPKAQAFYQQLQDRQLNLMQHVRKIVALSEIYGTEKTARALEDALELCAISSQYIANILQQRQRLRPEPGPLHLTRNQDLLDLELPEPDLNLYQQDNHEDQDHNPGNPR